VVAVVVATPHLNQMVSLKTHQMKTPTLKKMHLTMFLLVPLHLATQRLNKENK